MAGRFDKQLHAMRLLLVEDASQPLLYVLLTGGGFQNVERADTLGRALQALQTAPSSEAPYELVLVDYTRLAKEGERADELVAAAQCPVVVVVDRIREAERARLLKDGYDDVLASDGNRRVLLARLELILLRRYLSGEVRATQRQNRGMFLNILQLMAKVIEAKDPYTKCHSENVARHAYQIAQRMGYSDDELESIAMAGILHDFGKIGVGEDILNKPGKLSDEETEIVRRHPLIASTILDPIMELVSIIEDVRHHHEHYDGSGYPAGLKGKDIPLGARILAVAEAYDAMITDRAYRKAMTFPGARHELLKCAGTQFDPEIVDVFLEVLDKKAQGGRDSPQPRSDSGVTTPPTLRRLLETISRQETNIHLPPLFPPAASDTSAEDDSSDNDDA